MCSDHFGKNWSLTNRWQFTDGNALERVILLPMNSKATATDEPRENTARSGLQFCALLVLLLIAWFAAQHLEIRGLGSRRLLISLSVIGFWRWGWALLHCVRAVTFRYFVFPRMRRKAALSVEQHGPVPQLCVVATTYNEFAWITEKVVSALVREFRELSGVSKATQLVFITGGPEDDATVSRIFHREVAASAPPKGIPWPPELTLLRGADGKRQAIASGLKHLSNQNIHPDGVVVLMDGDSVPVDGALRKTMPIFRTSRKLGAVTTNERAVLKASTWFTEWIKLRFGQRHFYMCSLAFSRKLLCLTGRMSAFRADVATTPSFIEQIEDDQLEHWLFGRFKLFSGDDKSTWYWLNANRYDLMYVPDAMVVTYEVVTEGGVIRAIANMKRWSGNMLRNAGRAARLGPGKLRFFPWVCVLDQQISMWTVLIGPASISLAIASGYTEFAAAYVLWLMVTRTVRVCMSWWHGRRLSFWYIPIQLLSEWVGAAVKIWVYFNPVKQTWLNRGNRTLRAGRDAGLARIRNVLAGFYCLVSVTAFLVCVGSYTNLVPVLSESDFILRAGKKPPVQSFESGVGRVFFGAETTNGPSVNNNPGAAVSR